MLRVLTMFQNHYGWIETRLRDLVRWDAEQFQNHYGWIETTQWGNPISYRFLSFKTTTVGLRHAYPGVSFSYLGWFQNHYGWIETGLVSMPCDQFL